MNTWHKFTGKYEKQFYDIRFPNGVIYYGLWPNAGVFHIPAVERLWKRGRTLTNKDDFEIRLSEIDGLGMPIRGDIDVELPQSNRKGRNS